LRLHPAVFQAGLPRLNSIEFLYSMFDLPEADKCLLAFGELDVRCLQSASGGFDVQFL
jgi:hypothetical protein